MLRRPAARQRIRRPAVRERPPPAAEGGWADVKERSMSVVKIGEDMMVELVYEGERGQAYCCALDKIEDELALWIGVRLRGTNIAGLRHWRLNRGGGAQRLCISQEFVDEEHRLLQEGLGYSEKFRVTSEKPGEGWAFNCEDVAAEGAGGAETSDLMKAAQGLGFEGVDQEPKASTSSREHRRGAALIEEEEGEGHAGQSKVEFKGYSRGSSVQEGNLPAAEKEKEKQQFGRNLLRIRDLVARHWGRAPTEGDCEASSRLPGAQVSKGGLGGLGAGYGRGVGELPGLRALPQTDRLHSRRGSSSPAGDAYTGYPHGHALERRSSARSGRDRAEAEVLGALAARGRGRDRAPAGADPSRGIVSGQHDGGEVCSGRASRGPEAEEAALGEAEASLSRRRLERSGQDRQPRRQGVGKEGWQGEQGKGRQGEGVEGDQSRLLGQIPEPEAGGYEEAGPPVFSEPSSGHVGAGRGTVGVPRFRKSEVGEDFDKGQAITSVNVGARLVDLASRMLAIRPPSSRRVSKEHTQEITEDAFPLPLPRDHRDSVGGVARSWEEGLIRSLNWLSPGSFEVSISGDPPSRDQAVLLNKIRNLRN